FSITKEQDASRVPEINAFVIPILVYVLSQHFLCDSKWTNVASMVIPSFQNGYAHTLLMEIELSTLIDSYHWLSVIAYCFLDQTLNYYSNLA
ncbi:hypothetical protein EI555_003816, partial [Monodon monoceros]